MRGMLDCFVWMGSGIGVGRDMVDRISGRK
jgi:hypothetical protein